MSANVLAFIRMPGGYEWLVILGIALLIFGRRLPEMMRGLGKGVVEFKKGIRGEDDDEDQESDAPKKLDSSKTATADGSKMASKAEA